MRGAAPRRSVAPARTGLTTPMLVGLGGLAMLGPFATDAFLPALPSIAGEFAVSAGAAQLTLSGVTIGMAVGQLVSGPLSDAIGRRMPLLGGSAALAVFSLLAAVAPSLPVLTLACLVLGFGAAAGATVARAVVADLETGSALTRGFALLGSAMALGPVIAPVVGVALMLLWGWRGVFTGMAVLAALSFVFIAVLVPESLPRSRRVRGGIRAVPAAVAAAARTRTFWCGALVVWFAFAATFAYIAASPYVIQEMLGFSPVGYAGAFAVNGAGVVVAGLIAARLARRLEPQRIVVLGLSALTVGVVLVVAAVAAGMVTAWLVLPGFFLIAASCGFYIGPSLALAVHELRRTAGTALALVGAVQFAIAGLVSPLAVLGGPGDLTPLAVILAVGTLLAWCGWAAFRPRAPLSA
ncbi:multidrug effflux MFS transporter [Microbacterium caowuchunii]|uniref:Bcr/CflA family efflux MFS transporter n=1 Tax=Microbacterium caowuchunii TaxID=2614638 RepID=UPI001244BBC8|nr:Bcr/CflA family efflux MFS transporter [Microbacterium caowuchunii]QEW01089.1 multidrug effflux MFS transporter [Microbacterium caowuchunii]